MAKIIKIQIPGKIYWNGFTRQLKELYYLLLGEGYVSCSMDEFLKHFTGKKITDLGRPGGKLEWKKEKYMLVPLINHLVEKRFLDGTPEENIIIFKEHIDSIPESVFKVYIENKNKTAAKDLRAKIEMLFPATSGYRCKERLYYKARNREPQREVLKNCGVSIL